MWTSLWTIARNTFTESIRQPIYFVVVAGLVGLLTLNLMLAMNTLEDDSRMMIDMGLSTCLVMGMVLAAFTASGVLAREIENKTVLTVLSKPVGRPLFVIGKYLGVTAAVSLAYWIAAMTFLLTVRHKVMSAVSDPVDWPVLVLGGSAIVLALLLAAAGNYLYGWVFSSAFTRTLAVTLTLAYLMVLMLDKQWHFQPITTEFVNPQKTNYGEEAKSLAQIILALVLVLEAVWMMCAVAVASSTRLGWVMTLGVCVLVLVLGVLSDYLFGQHQANVLARTTYVVVPNLQVPFILDALHRNKPVGPGYLATVSGYLGCMTMALLALAVALFQGRQTT